LLRTPKRIGIENTHTNKEETLNKNTSSNTISQTKKERKMCIPLWFPNLNAKRNACAPIKKGEHEQKEEKRKY